MACAWQSAEARDDLTLAAPFESEGTDGGGESSEPIDMPVQCLLPPEMAPQSGINPSGTICTPRIKIMAGGKLMNDAAKGKAHGLAQRDDENVCAFPICGAAACRHVDRRGAWQRRPNSGQQWHFNRHGTHMTVRPIQVIARSRIDASARTREGQDMSKQRLTRALRAGRLITGI